MYASADWQVWLVLPRFGFMQSPTLANVAFGQNCLMSLAHSLETQMAFDRMVEQPTESSPTCACKQARTRPPPGLTPAQRDWTSVLQSRSVSKIPNPCALAPEEPASSNPAPNAIANNDFVMVLSFWSPPQARAASDSPTHPAKAALESPLAMGAS